MAYGNSVPLCLDVEHIYQCDSDYNDIQMQGNTSLAGDTIGHSGFAITCCAMVINYLENMSITPLTLNSSRFLDTSNGAKWSDIAAAYHRTDSGYYSDVSGAKDWIDKGYPVIFHISKGHFVVGVGYDSSNTYMIQDPGKSNSTAHPWTDDYSAYKIDKFRVFY